VGLLLETKQQYPLWVPEKIRKRLMNLNVSGEPAAGTTGDLLRYLGLVNKRFSPAFKLTQPHVLHHVVSTENSRYERMHRTMKEAMNHHSKFTSLEEQQDWLDAWRHEFNEVRPHKALGGRTPQSAWYPSTRIFTGPLKDMPV